MTFDDGPDSKTTPRLMETLYRLSIPATMFVLGERAEANPALLRECSAADHQIGVHGYTHESFMLHRRSWQSNSIRRTEAVLADNGIRYQRLFRPPHGRFNWATSRALAHLNYSGVLWSQIAGDWTRQDPIRLAMRLCNGLHDGSIIVLHDGHDTTANMIQALPRLADEVASRGWHFVTLPQSPTFPQPTTL